MANRYLCIHGHFYQPPRENPWLAEIELQESAHPFHDWNQRIAAECYAPNTAARILDAQGRITDIVNNYSQMSFNFGPTLLSWLERHDPETYRAIIESDSESRENFSGHGSAMAQGYNHLIMPLANSRDKRTQVRWGIRDFEYRFARKPEGLWLPETAVDIESLEMLAEEGIVFTILAPHQARAVRRIGAESWQDVSGSRIDPRHPYRCPLPSGKNINLFFYDGPVSRAIAFEPLLDSGTSLIERLMSVFQMEESPQLVHIATDGETYGHHHHRGDMALAYVLREIQSRGLAKITNYAEYLEKNPPESEVQIFVNSSWSCVHGIERWRADCGCNSGMHSGWHQQWRRPLRETMDWLRDQLIMVFEQEGGKYFRDIWQARDDYLDVVLNRSRDNVDRFLNRQALRPLPPTEKIACLKLLEMQRHAMLMYTSCGWFFDEVSGIENVQILRYAARAIQLAREAGGVELEDAFVDHLRRVPANDREYHNGAHIFEKCVKPSVVDLNRVAAHYAVSSLFESYPETARIYSYSAITQKHERQEDGSRKVSVGKALVRSEITWEEKPFQYAVYHHGDEQIMAGVKSDDQERDFVRMQRHIIGIFRKNDFARVSRMIARYFPNSHYSLQHLFKDEQLQVLYQILDHTLNDVESCLRQINQHHYPITQVVKQLNVPLPRMMAHTISVLLDTDLLRVLATDPIDFPRLEALVKESQEWMLEVDKKTLAFVARRRINSFMQTFLKYPRQIKYLQIVEQILTILSPLGLSFEFWTAQNIYFWVGKRIYTPMNLRMQKGDGRAKEWVEAFDRMGKSFNVLIK